MYEIKVYECKDKWIVEFENVKVSFDKEKQATKFVLEMLKDTGRIGY